MRYLYAWVTRQRVGHVWHHAERHGIMPVLFFVSPNDTAQRIELKANGLLETGIVPNAPETRNIHFANHQG